jgi:thiol:disulfide interchange protein
VDNPAREEGVKHVVGWGVVLVLLGAWLWLSQLGVPYCDFGRDWPLLLVAFGVWRITRRIARAARRPRRRRSVLDDLETGRIDAETAIVRIKGSI